MTVSNRSTSWAPCPAGSLNQLDRNLRRRRRSKLMRESAALVVLATCIGLTAGYLATPGIPPNEPTIQNYFAGLSCDDVRTAMPAFVGHRLDADTAARVQQHLMECPKCQQLMQRMQSMQSSNRNSTEQNRPRIQSIAPEAS